MCNANQIWLDTYNSSNTENELLLFIALILMANTYACIHKRINDSLHYHCVNAPCVLIFNEYIFDKEDGLNKLN